MLRQSNVINYNFCYKNIILLLRFLKSVFSRRGEICMKLEQAIIYLRYLWLPAWNPPWLTGMWSSRYSSQSPRGHYHILLQTSPHSDSSALSPTCRLEYFLFACVDSEICTRPSRTPGFHARSTSSRWLGKLLGRPSCPQFCPTRASLWNEMRELPRREIMEAAVFFVPPIYRSSPPCRRNWAFTRSSITTLMRTPQVAQRSSTEAWASSKLSKIFSMSGTMSCSHALSHYSPVPIKLNYVLYINMY